MVIPNFHYFDKSIVLPKRDKEIKKVLHSAEINKIICYVLGPSGTNIEQAYQKWLNRLGIIDKSAIHYCKTPEESIELAKDIQSPNEVGIFWTCAVYHREREIFFENPDAFPFFHQQAMNLDNMQLSTRKDFDISTINFQNMRIASHPSPSRLLGRSFKNIITVNSNSEAAQYCASNKVDACITTEHARKNCDLVTVHSFGSPRMLFFAGIAGQSANLISNVFRKIFATDKSDNS